MYRTHLIYDIGSGFPVKGEYVAFDNDVYLVKAIEEVDDGERAFAELDFFCDPNDYGTKEFKELDLLYDIEEFDEYEDDELYEDEEFGGLYEDDEEE